MVGEGIEYDLNDKASLTSSGISSAIPVSFVRIGMQRDERTLFSAELLGAVQRSERDALIDCCVRNRPTVRRA